MYLDVHTIFTFIDLCVLTDVLITLDLFEVPNTVTVK